MINRGITIQAAFRDLEKQVVETIEGLETLYQRVFWSLKEAGSPESPPRSVEIRIHELGEAATHGSAEIVRLRAALALIVRFEEERHPSDRSHYALNIARAALKEGG